MNLAEPSAWDEWAKGLVHWAAFTHVGAEPRCTGYTMASSGRATCGACGWRMSAWVRDAGTTESARFALAALAQVGAAFSLALGLVVTALFETILA